MTFPWVYYHQFAVVKIRLYFLHSCLCILLIYEPVFLFFGHANSMHFYKNNFKRTSRHKFGTNFSKNYKELEDLAWKLPFELRIRIIDTTGGRVRLGRNYPPDINLRQGRLEQNNILSVRGRGWERVKVRENMDQN